MQLWMCEDISNHSGGNGKRDPPVLIPNTEVKPLRAECTWLDTARETMAPPDITKSTSKEVLFLFIPPYLLFLPLACILVGFMV